jgi:hypothetical protein
MKEAGSGRLNEARVTSSPSPVDIPTWYEVCLLLVPLVRVLDVDFLVHTAAIAETGIDTARFGQGSGPPYVLVNAEFRTLMRV